MTTVDLNCDLGESAEPAQRALDARLLRAASSVNVACGVHGGDPEVMRGLVRLARDSGVAIGAHPGFPDPAGGGRRERRASPEEVETLVAYQVGALAGVAALEGARLHHVKPHGALYNMAARDPALAAAIGRGVRVAGEHAILVGLAGSAFVATLRDLGFAVAEEAFADRGYNPDGTLVPRDRPDALLTDADEVVARVLRLCREHSVLDVTGRPVPVKADTICLHGDTPGADELALAIRRALEAAGVRIAPLAPGHA